MFKPWRSERVICSRRKIMFPNRFSLTWINRRLPILRIRLRGMLTRRLHITPTIITGHQPIGTGGIGGESPESLGLLLLPVLLAFLDHLLLGVARHFLVMTEILGVNATTACQRAQRARIAI